MSTETADLTARFVYVTANPDNPPYDYVGRHRRKFGRTKALLTAALGAVGITLTLACGGTATPDIAGIGSGKNGTIANDAGTSGGVDAGSVDDLGQTNGDDTVDGGLGNDDVNGNQGIDLVHGGDGADWVLNGERWSSPPAAAADRPQESTPEAR